MAIEIPGTPEEWGEELEEWGQAAREGGELIEEGGALVGDAKEWWDRNTGQGGQRPDRYPGWFPDFSDYAPGQPREAYYNAAQWIALTLRGLNKLGATEADVIAIGALPDTAGIAPDGAEFDALPPEAQRHVVANRIVGSYAQMMRSPEAVDAFAKQLRSELEARGWQRLGTRPGCSGDMDATGLNPSGTPCQPGFAMRSDGQLGPGSAAAQAAARLLAVVRGQWPRQGMAGQYVVPTAPSAISGGRSIEECKAEPTPVQRLDCFATAGHTANLLATEGPYRPVATPGKAFELVQGLDGNRYLVVAGAGIRLLYAAGLVTAGGALWLLRSKSRRAKKLRKRLNL